MVEGVEIDRPANYRKVCLQLADLCPFTRRGKTRYGNGGDQPDDDRHRHQLDEREASLSAFSAPHGCYPLFPVIVRVAVRLDMERCCIARTAYRVWIQVELARIRKGIVQGCE